MDYSKNQVPTFPVTSSYSPCENSNTVSHKAHELCESDAKHKVDVKQESEPTCTSKFLNNDSSVSSPSISTAISAALSAETLTSLPSSNVLMNQGIFSPLPTSPSPLLTSSLLLGQHFSSPVLDTVLRNTWMLNAYSR